MKTALLEALMRLLFLCLVAAGFYFVGKRDADRWYAAHVTEVDIAGAGANGEYLQCTAVTGSGNTVTYPSVKP